jgi:hypothetical protein
MLRYATSLRWVLASMLLTAVIAGCGGGSSESTESKGGTQASGAAAGSVDVALTEWAVKPSATKAKAGEVTF